jgi:uncharacterized membrane-anchored protein YjiN (DUF445 family)
MEFPDYLIGIIIFLFYCGNAIWKALRNNTQEEEESPEEQERARKIQAAIRRRIQEQKGEHAPTLHRETELHHDVILAEPPITINKPHAREMHHEPENFQPLYSKEIEQRLIEIRAAKEKAKALKKHVSKNETATDAYAQNIVKKKTSILPDLKDPNGAKKGFLYYEILGTPVSLRNNGRLKPSWEQ